MLISFARPGATSGTSVPFDRFVAVGDDDVSVRMRSGEIQACAQRVRQQPIIIIEKTAERALRDQPTRMASGGHVAFGATQDRCLCRESRKKRVIDARTIHDDERLDDHVMLREHAVDGTQQQVGARRFTSGGDDDGDLRAAARRHHRS
ncbi:MAG: hypothetical protein QM803_06120 [Rhodocyclaceae bacterium]